VAKKSRIAVASFANPFSPYAMLIRGMKAERSSQLVREDAPHKVVHNGKRPGTV